MNKTKKGLNLVELGIVVVIITVLLGIIGINGYNLYQNAIDTKIQENLRSLTDATQLFMVDTNGAAPCFSKEVTEGTTGKITTGVCTGTGAKYDYEQGKTSNDLDFDGISGEAFTFQNILAPSYIPSIPKEGRSWQKYLYTKGDSSTNQGISSFAYTALLAGTKAEDKLDNNTSIINVVGEMKKTGTSPSTTTSWTNSTTLTEATMKGCTNMEKIAEIGADKGYEKIVGWIVPEATACDLYSDGMNISTGGVFENNLKTIVVQ